MHNHGPGYFGGSRGVRCGSPQRDRVTGRKFQSVDQVVTLGQAREIVDAGFARSRIANRARDARIAVAVLAKGEGIALTRARHVFGLDPKLSLSRHVDRNSLAFELRIGAVARTVENRTGTA